MLSRKLAFLCVAALCLQGCRIARLAELSSLGAEPEQFADLPVPRDYQLSTGAGKSWSHREGEFRAAHLLYKGHGGIDGLEQFLGTQLEKQGWELVEKQRPYHGKIKQQWTRRPRIHVVNVLTATLMAKGARTELLYDLATRRTGRALPADADHSKKTKKSQPEAAKESGKEESAVKKSGQG